MLRRTPDRHAVAIVLGCGDVGSAIAHALHTSGFSVVLVDEADPAWHRRGMTFTNAWYFGNAELDGERACFCASLKSIPSVLARGMIAATTWSWPGIAGALAPTVLVDARRPQRRGARILRGCLPITIGIGRGFVGGENVDVAIGLPGGFPDGGLDDSCRGDADSGGDSGHGHRANCLVEAARHGRFMTERRIGDTVGVGQIVGGLGNEVVAAPASGVLLGLAARGARIEPGDILVQVDPGGMAHECYGVGKGTRRIAERVLSVLTRPGDPGHGSSWHAAEDGAQLMAH